MSEPLDDAHLHDPATLALRQYHTLKDNGASQADQDIAYRQYLDEVENLMNLKKKTIEKAA